MGRTKKRSKAKSAAARTRVEDGQDGASASAVEVVRRQNEPSLAAKLPTKVLERIVTAYCPSAFGFDNYIAALDHGPHLGIDRALTFAHVCKSWRDVGLAAYWRHTVVVLGYSARAEELERHAGPSRHGLVSELSVVAPNMYDQALPQSSAAAVLAQVGEHLRALFLMDEPALEVFRQSIPTGGLPSLVELHVTLSDVDLKQTYEIFAHMPKLEYFNCGLSYVRHGGASVGRSARPHMPAPRRRLTRLDVRLELETPETMKHARVELDVLLNLLYVADLTSVRELRLNYNFSHAIPSQITPLLRHLRILRLLAAAPLFPSFPTALTSMLADLPNLVALDVELMRDHFGRDVGTISPSDAAALLAALPPSLKVALVEFDFSPPASSSHLAAFLARRLAEGVLERWTSVRGSRVDATLKTTWRRCGGGGGGGGEDEPARWAKEDFEESEASPRIV